MPHRERRCLGGSVITRAALWIASKVHQFIRNDTAMKLSIAWRGQQAIEQSKTLPTSSRPATPSPNCLKRWNF